MRILTKSPSFAVSAAPGGRVVAPYSLFDFIIVQFLSCHSLLDDYADAVYSYYIMVYGYISNYRWIYKQHFCGCLSRLSFSSLNRSPALVCLNGWSHASPTASSKASSVSCNAMQVLSFYFSLNDLIPKQNYCLTCSEVIVLGMFYLPELS